MRDYNGRIFLVIKTSRIAAIPRSEAVVLDPPPSKWLCHSDARQVSDLPEPEPLFLKGLRPGGHRPLNIEKLCRQVSDLPVWVSLKLSGL
jgi:hypothetical protein